MLRWPGQGPLSWARFSPGFWQVFRIIGLFDITSCRSALSSMSNHGLAVNHAHPLGLNIGITIFANSSCSLTSEEIIGNFSHNHQRRSATCPRGICLEAPGSKIWSRLRQQNRGASWDTEEDVLVLDGKRNGRIGFGCSGAHGEVGFEFEPSRYQTRTDAAERAGPPGSPVRCARDVRRGETGHCQTAGRLGAEGLKTMGRTQRRLTPGVWRTS